MLLPRTLRQEFLTLVHEGIAELPSLSERIQRRVQRRLQYDVQPQAPVYDFPVQALMGIITRQERAMRAHMLPECHHVRQYDNSPPEYLELFPDGPPAQSCLSMPTSPPPMHAVAVEERIQRDLSSAEVYGPIIWPTEPFSEEDPPHWEQRHPE